MTDAPTITFTEPYSEKHFATVWKTKDKSLAPLDAPTLAINESFNVVRNHKDERVIPFDAVDLNFSGTRRLLGFWQRRGKLRTEALLHPMLRP